MWKQGMRTSTAMLMAAMTLSLTMGFAAEAQTDAPAISTKASWIVSSLRSLDVEHRWIAGAHVNWQTGLPDDETETLPGRHTHCSAFVASAAMKLGVYILRPPEHGQVLLANAQYEWLETQGASHGWRRVDGPEQAQALANRGDLVVASYRSHLSNKPGHIAIVLPGSKSDAQIEAEGPDVMEAANSNNFSTPLATGFAGHPRAWGGHEVVFYAHAVNAPK
jgi:hypothetical protein